MSSPCYFPPPTQSFASFVRKPKEDTTIGMLLLLVVLCLCESCTPENVTGYDPSELLSQIFNSDTEPRGGYGLINQNYDPGDTNHVVLGDGQQGFRKKRRRKPKKTLQYVGGYINNGNSFYGRPVPRPSLAAQALSSVTEALTSIAKYDDYQCVPRLLCEASGGMGTGIPSVPGLESLLTLLSAYTGMTTNPLFVFGRAVYLGVSSRGNPASCRYAYPQCPTDPEKLVHYLNNHNGGFFRFFNSPQQQQNLEQFYQNYQLPEYIQDPYPQHVGQYGLYKPNTSGNQQQYGSAYNYKYKTSEIQKRIQNKPNSNLVDEADTKWTFPEDNGDFVNGFHVEEDLNDFKFPDNIKNDRKTRGFAFPSNFIESPAYNQPNDIFVFSNQNQIYDDERKYRDYNKYFKQNNKGGNTYNLYNNPATNYNYNNAYEEVQTVYVVRGNGDPNRPEVIKLKPGQSISDY